MNIGQMLPYGSQQLYKNLFAANPGFNNTQYQSVLYCKEGTTPSLCVTGSNVYFPAGFWPADGTVSIRVLTGLAAGCTTTLGGFNNSNITLAGSCNISPGDYIAVKKIIAPGAAGFNPTYGWNTNTSGSPVFSTSSDVPPSSNGTTYTQSLRITTPTANDVANLAGDVDTLFLPWLGSTRSFINLTGTYTVSYWAKAVSGTTPEIMVSLYRGSTAYVNQVPDHLTTTWTQYTHTFTAAEIGPQADILSLNFTTVGAESILLDKVSVAEAPTPDNPTVFRNDVVSTLKSLKPGVLRMSDQTGLTNSFQNMMVDQWGRMPVNFATAPLNGAPGYYNPITYSIPDFLQLCQTVGAEAWITLPVTLTQSEANELIDYLSGPASTVGGALRQAQGFTAPWTSVLPKIHLELGNEEWDGTFEGGSMEYNYGVYSSYAQGIFAAMKSNPNYNFSATSLAINAQFVNTYLLQIIQNNCNNNDEIGIAPYTADTLTDSSSIANIWQPGLSEPQVFWQPGAASGPNMICAEYTSGALCPSAGYFSLNGTEQPVYGGGMYLAALAEANSNHPVPVSIYEENNSARQGNFTQTQLNAYASAWGAGLMQASQFLTNLQNGILTQNLYQLAQYFTVPSPSPNSSGASYLYLWGSVVDMGGPTNLRRPQFLAEQLINSGITPGGTMLNTKQTGTPTYSVGNPATGTTVNTVATSSVNTLQSFAFTDNSGNYSLLLLNLDVDKNNGSHPVTFSGPNAPTGQVSVTKLTSANLGDNNETSGVIAPSTSTLTNPTGLTLSPYSMYLLTWSTAATAKAPVISNIAVAPNSPTSATITWTTDASSSSLVNYGLTPGYGSQSALNPTLVQNHSVTLTGLTPGTTYNFDVVSAVSPSLSSSSSNGTFTTASVSTSTPPTIGYVNVWGITYSGATVTWSSSVPATAQLAYGTTPALGQLSPLQTNLASSHGVVLSGLNSGTTYYFVAQSTANGATGYSTTFSFTTGGVAQGGTPPSISNVTVIATTSASATITWTTDQPSSSQVNFGLSPAYGSVSVDSTLVTVTP